VGGRGGRAFKTGEVSKSEAFFGLNQQNGMDNSWRHGLTLAQFEAMRRYTGSDYVDINNALRRLQLASSPADIQRCVDNMTEAISKFQLKKSITVFRGASSSIFGGHKTAAEINAMAKAGAHLTDRGFMSTSASFGAEFSGNYKFVITVPAGTGRGAYVAPFSHFRSENEFLLQRNTTFRITKAIDKGSITEVHLRVVPDKKKKK